MPLILVSVTLHALVATVVGRWATDLKERIESAPPAALEPAAPAVPFAFACTVDIGSMVAARLAYCASPMVGDAGECATRAVDGLEAELILCEMQPTDMPALSVNDAAEVRLVDPKAIAAIKPMPLIPALPPSDPATEAKKAEERVEEKVEQEKREEMRAAASAQIVEITQPKLEMRPDKARYVSEFDSKVDKQTVARASTDKMVARPGATKDPHREIDDTPKVLQPRETETTQGIPGARPGRAGAPGLLAMRGGGGALSPLQRLSRDSLSSGARLPGTDGLEPMPGDRKPGGAGPGEQGGGGGDGGDGGAKVPNLRPSEDMLQKMVGGGSVDKLDDAEQGIETALNSRRWKYASFFNRMKRRVAQNWHPAEVYMRRDPTGRVYGSKDRLTVLKVSLTPTGQLADVVVLEGSGVSFLDDEAVRAFRAAQPFPNPPHALVEAGTQLITFSFGFHFQIDGPSDAWWKFRRY